MSTDSVLLAVEGFVARITLNRPECLNALNSQVFAGLERAADELAAMPDVRAVVLTGAGTRAFCAGIDLKAVAAGDLRQIGGWENGWLGLITRTKAVPNMIESLSIPVIAAIRGHCLGGGLELALACDIRLAAEGAHFGMPEAKLGIVPDLGGTQRLPRIVGQGKARELIYSARTIDAAEALRIGLVEHVYPPERLLEEAMALAREIAHHPPVAVRAAKRAISATQSLPLDAGLRVETEAAATALRMDILEERGRQLGSEASMTGDEERIGHPEERS